MIGLAILPSVDTLMERQRLVGWIVREGIINSGSTYTKAAKRWPMALPTLNRLMNTGDVGLKFYAIAEKNLDLPRGLLSMVVDGERDAIAKVDDPRMDESLRSYILAELGPPSRPRGRRRTDNA